jgi:hypothetical protein
MLKNYCAFILIRGYTWRHLGQERKVWLNIAALPTHLPPMSLAPSSINDLSVVASGYTINDLLLLHVNINVDVKTELIRAEKRQGSVNG